MKKLLLVVSLTVAGVVSASTGNPTKFLKLEESKVTNTVDINSEIIKEKRTKLVDYVYSVSVATSCGKTENYNHTFNYPPTEQDFQNVLNSWNQIHCNGQPGGKITRSTSIYPS